LLLSDFALRKKVRAVFRYWIWMLVLVKLILPTSLSTPLSLGYFFGDELAFVNINRLITEAEPTEPAPAIVSPTIDFTNIQDDNFTTTPVPIIPATEPILKEPSQPPAESVTPLSWQGAVFLLWLTVVITMGLLLLQRAIFVRRLIAQAKEANSMMNDTLESCRERIRVKRKIGLKVSANAESPAVCGLFRPVILVPKYLASNLSSSQLRAVLLHELAHIRRGDLWVNLAQTVLQIIYFYNPLLWLANAIIRRVREQAVDEMVLVAMGAKAQQYPETLVNVAKLAFKRPALSLRLIGVVESKSALAGRIKHILNRPMPKKAKLGILGLAVVIIIAAILLPMATCTPGPPGLVIKGTVKDAQTGEPIAGARVFDDGYGPKPNWEQIKADVRSEWGAITNSAGEYSFLTWPEHHSIKVEAPGYKPERQSLYDGHFTFNKKDEETFNFVLEPEKASDSSEFKTKLPNGVTVELVGVCEHPNEGKQWWRPDGSILEPDHAPSDHSRMTVKPDETEQARELALRFAGQDVEHISFTWEIDMATRSSSHPFYVTEKREKLKPLRNIVFKLPQNLETLDFSIGVATGEWKRVASGGDGRTVSGTNDSLTDSSVIFHEAVKEKDTVRLCATHLLGGDYDCRIMVVDRDDEIHGPIRGSNSGSDMRLCKGFFDLSPDQIKYILLQARPYEWVEFKNVSLRPGHKTDVQVGKGEGTAEAIMSMMLLGMEVADVTPDIQKRYELYHPYGVVILNPGYGHERLGIGKLTEGLYFWKVGNKEIHNLREMIAEILRINANARPQEGGSVGQGYEGFIRIVYGYRRGKGTNTQYLKPTKADIEELRRAGKALGIPDEKLYSGNQKEMEARMESAKKLSDFGKALFIYANDHDDKYPVNIEEVNTYLRNKGDLDWLIENIEYLGKGKSAIISPTSPLAYDETLLKKKNFQGTNVLYNDGRATFEKAEKLKKLGIISKYKPDVQVDNEKPRTPKHRQTLKSLADDNSTP